MLLRASIAVLLFLFCLAISTKAQISESMLSAGRARFTSGSVTGTVTGPDGTPWGGIRVELSDLGLSTPINTAYTQQDGSFEFDNLPTGNYRVIAYSEMSQARETVTVQYGGANVSLRFSDANYGADPTISIAQMLVPERARSFYNRAREALAKGNNAEVQKQLAKALQAYPQFSEALTLRGILEWRGKDADHARADLEQAIQLDPNYSPAYMALGDVYNAQGRFDDALRTLDHGVAIAPRSWQGYFEMARASIGKGMFEQALKLAERAENMGGSSFAPIHLLKAYAMIPLKFYKGASQELQAFLAREPKGQNAERAQRMLAQVKVAEMAAGTSALH